MLGKYKVVFAGFAILTAIIIIGAAFSTHLSGRLDDLAGTRTEMSRTSSEILADLDAARIAAERDGFASGSFREHLDRVKARLGRSTDPTVDAMWAPWRDAASRDLARLTNDATADTAPDLLSALRGKVTELSLIHI